MMRFIMSSFCLLAAGLCYAQQPSQSELLQQLQRLQQRALPQPTASKPTSANQEQSPTQPKVPAKAAQSVDSGVDSRHEPTPPVLQGMAQQAIDEAAFRSAMKETFPLTPEQILRLRQNFNLSQRAQATTPGIPPKPIATSLVVNLSPGSTPPVIRLAQGFVSSIVFVDSSGAPWPIYAYDLGNPQAFNVVWDNVSNTLMIQANDLYTYGNLAVRLQGLNTPVMLTLVPGQKVVDYRVDLRIQAYGPKATLKPTGETLPPSINPELLKVLDGVLPTTAREVVVSGGEAQAWVVNEQLLLRTRLTVLSPGYVDSVTSADGMHVYAMQTAPVLLASHQGKVIQLNIEGL